VGAAAIERTAAEAAFGGDAERRPLIGRRRERAGEPANRGGPSSLLGAAVRGSHIVPRAPV